ncbi:MAG: hypothetical protein J7621_29985 [Niastella sp.]|nr:hypothetical protein [Niastella sp.]
MRITILLPLFIICSVHTFSQTTFDTKKKYSYFKAWNWLKYYHPDLATGKVKADSLFLKHWPAINQAKESKSFNQAVLQMINTLTPPAAKATDKPTDTTGLLLQNLDTTWLTKESLIMPALRIKLRQVYSNRFQGDDHYYIPAKNYETEIPNEPVYAFTDSLNVPYEYRMLALAKIQGTGDYLFPHKYLMDKDWNTTVLHFIPLFTTSNTRRQYEKCLLQITAAFKDSHTYKFYSAIKNRKAIFRSQHYPPFDYQVVDNKILVTHIIIPELCKKAGIEKGDLITTLSGVSVEERIKELAGLLSTSNKTTLLHKLNTYTNNFLFIADKPSITVNILRNNKTIKTELPYIQLKDTGYLRMLNNHLTRKGEGVWSDELDYISAGIIHFKIDEAFRFIQKVPDEKIDRTMDSLLTLASTARGIIFDMRGYPDWGGFISYLYKKFGRKGETYGRYYTVNKENMGTYKYLSQDDVYFVPGVNPENTPYTGEVVIIVNPDTRSMSEWNTMQLQMIFPNSITIGQQTSGGDGDERMINIPGNYVMPFTGNAVFYPDGTVAQRKGVKIDIPVYPTIPEILTGKDIPLIKAIELINKK